MAKTRAKAAGVKKATSKATAKPKPAPNAKAASKPDGRGKISAVPPGYHTITPHLVVRGAAQAIDFYKRAFGAQEIRRVAGPGGSSLMHAALKIGDSHVFLVDEFPDMGCLAPPSLHGSPVTIHLYVEDVDQVFHRAVAAGAQVKMPVSDMFWGDRYGQVIDPFGHWWSIASQKEQVSPAAMEQRMAAQFGAGHKPGA